MKGDSATYVCETCGRTHLGLPTDRAFKLPDEVWAIPEGERQERAKWTSDLCQMGDKYFIRSFLPLPFKNREGHFGWGVWVKVSWPVFERYLQIYERTLPTSPKLRANLQITPPRTNCLARSRLRYASAHHHNVRSSIFRPGPCMLSRKSRHLASATRVITKYSLPSAHLSPNYSLKRTAAGWLLVLLWVIAAAAA